MLEYTTAPNGIDTIVKLDKKHVGTIFSSDSGFQYTPKGNKPGGNMSGEMFSTFIACKRSLESQADGE